MFFSLYSVNILKYVFAMEHTRTATFETEQIENVFVIIIHLHQKLNRIKNFYVLEDI